MKYLLPIISLIAVFFLLSFRLLDTPPGLTIDEAAFGYNATLLSRTLHDQNGRLLPVFVLSIDGQDWRQPVTQYYQAAFFRLFGASVLNLRLSSVVVTLFALILLYYLTHKLLGTLAAVAAATIFITTPIVFFQAHLGLDNNVPMVFTLLWLISLHRYHRQQKPLNLFAAGIALGLSFYSYKAMRAILPVWSFLTLADIFISSAPFLRRLKHSLYFILGLAPFLLVIPWLETHYAGAVFDKHGASFGDIYSFLFPYLSSFDLSFLFLQGDATLYHSTQRHGMFLLASLPLFVIGLYQAVKKDRFWLLIVISLFTAPILYGMVNSVHRASRLMAFVPQFCLVASLSLESLRHSRFQLPLVIFVACLYLLNFTDFVGYFWYQYPVVSQTGKAYGQLSQYQSFAALASQSQKTQLTPYINRTVYLDEGESAHFFEAIYFTTPLQQWDSDDQPTPPGTILLSTRDNIPGMDPLQLPLPRYHLHINP